jgi:hypothetical protein
LFFRGFSTPLGPGAMGVIKVYKTTNAKRFGESCEVKSLAIWYDFRGAEPRRSGIISHMLKKAAKNEARTWLLRCVKCKSHFNVGISPSESIILIAQKTLCPNCGHLPTLTHPDAFLSAAQIHRLVRVTPQWERSRPVQGRVDRRLRKGETISVVEPGPNSERDSRVSPSTVLR